MLARHVIIRGVVQGVGYRDWLVMAAKNFGLSGWVRNLSDGTVEALLAGEAEAVAACLGACRHGPPLAEVTSIKATPSEVSARAGFMKLPSV